MKKLFFTLLIVSAASAMFAQTSTRLRSEDTNNPEIDNLSGLKPDEETLIETGTTSGLTENTGGTISTSTNDTHLIVKGEGVTLDASKEITLESTLVYPNPATNYLTISTDDVTSGTIRILNLLGQEQASYNITGTLTSIDITALGEGIYFVSVESGSQKIVKKIKVLY